MIQRLPRGILGCLVALIMGVAASPAFSQNSLTVGSDSVAGLGSASVDVTMTADDDVQGYVLSIGFDTMELSITDIAISANVAAIGAELVAPEIFEAAGGVTLGVVLDAASPFDGQVIPAGSGISLATVSITPDVVVPPGGTTIVSPLSLVDGAFNNPPLDNIIVIAGLSIGAGQGLTLNDGAITLLETAPDTLSIESTSTPSDTAAAVRVLLDLSTGPCQGFVLAIGHDDSVVGLSDINLSGTVTAAAGAEFVVPSLLATGGTVGVVLDFDPPFDGQTIPLGSGLHIANYVYTCNEVVTYELGQPAPAPVCGALTFQDGTFGSPALDNVIVVGGLSFNPSLVDGEICCEAVEVPVENTAFLCGVLDANGDLVDPVVSPGDTTQICFFYTEGTPTPQGGCVDGENIQGFQLGLSYDCDLNFVQGTFSLEGSILDAIGAEFVSHSVDNDPNDGDGCEIIIGILMDALPPFDGQTAPPSCEPLLIGCIDVEVSEDAPCNSSLPITFEDGVNGGENVPIENIVVIDNESRQGISTFDCNIVIQADLEFARGDCNGDTKVDLADAASVLAQQFQGFPVPCLDACDANDDGKINLADTVFILNYLFDSGPVPPAPGPDLDPGPDPTDDDLDCEAGIDTCP